MKIHLKTKETIEEKAQYYAANANKHKRKVLFEPGDLVWVHLRKERFPEKGSSKLMPRGDGPSRVLAKVNNNAYKIELPGNDYGVSTTFNVSDLSPFFGPEETESRTTPFQEGEDDENGPRSPSSSINTPIPQVHQGPMTRARTRQIAQQVNLFLDERPLDLSLNGVLHNTLIICTLRFEGRDLEDVQNNHFRSSQEIPELPTSISEPPTFPNSRQITASEPPTYSGLRVAQVRASGNIGASDDPPDVH